MVETKQKTAIFSCRTDPVHVGHILTICKLFTYYGFKRVVVVVLDYSEREACTAKEAVDIFAKIFCHMDLSITLMINKEHFGFITRDEYLEVLKRADVKFEDAVYVAGNPQVIEHFKNDLKLPHIDIPRSLDYNSTAEREIMRRGKLTIEQYLEESGE